MARTPARTTRTSRRVASEDGSILVKVARTGGTVTEVCLNGGRTVEDALEAADISSSTHDRIRVNGSSASLDDELKANDIVTISGKIQGGGK